MINSIKFFQWLTALHCTHTSCSFQTSCEILHQTWRCLKSKSFNINYSRLRFHLWSSTSSNLMFLNLQITTLFNQRKVQERVNTKLIKQIHALDISWSVCVCDCNFSRFLENCKEGALQTHAADTWYLVLVRIRQSLGGFCGVRQLDVETQCVSLTIAGGVMLPKWLMKFGAFLAAPRVAKLVVTQRGLQVACRIKRVKNISRIILTT